MKYLLTLIIDRLIIRAFEVLKKLYDAFIEKMQTERAIHEAKKAEDEAKASSSVEERIKKTEEFLNS